MEPPLLLNQLTVLRNCARTMCARGEFAKQICATIACNRGLVLIPVTLHLIKFFQWDCISRKLML